MPWLKHWPPTDRRTMTLINVSSIQRAAIISIALFAQSVFGQGETQPCSSEVEEANKAAARHFYEQVWFTNNPDVVDEVFAPEYIAHDIGDVKGVTEPAEMQKQIAGFLWENGNMTGSIDYQIADCNMVATRWQWKFQPTSLLFKVLGGRDQIPIINVFRFQDGKIVEIWNHRHDIDTGMGNVGFFKGIAVGLVPGLILLVISIVLWRRQKRSMRTTE